MNDDRKQGEGKGFTINDQRWWLRDDVDLETMSGQAAAKVPTFVEELEERLAQKDKQLREVIERQRAANQEVNDARQRLERDFQRQLDVERGRLVEPLLEVLDNFERFLASTDGVTDIDALHQGAALLYKQLGDRLGEMGLKPIPAAGLPFDPQSMEALTTSAVDASQHNVVLEVLRTGYAVGERIIRPAGVRVGLSEQG